MIDYSTAIVQTNRRLYKPVPSLRVDPLEQADWPTVRAIYQEGIDGGQATFETTAPDWASWHVSHRADCRLVARRGGMIIGWTALSPVSWRSVFGGVAEVSIYVAGAMHRQGVGRSLLTALIDASETAGIWTLQSGIFPENEASVALHLSCGFHIIGRRERVGFHQGVWRDALLLERRSSRVGISER